MLFPLLALELSASDSLRPQIHQLDTARVEIKRPGEARFNGANRSFTVDPQSAAGKSSLDLLRDLPSVQVDGNDRIKLRGSDQIKILLDGQPIENAELQNLSASQIASIEIQNNPDASQSAEGKGGLILFHSILGSKVGLSGSLGSGISYAPLGGNIQQSLRYGKGAWALGEQMDLRSQNRNLSSLNNQVRMGTSGGSQSQDTMSMIMGSLRLSSQYTNQDFKWISQWNARAGSHQKNGQGQVWENADTSLWEGQDSFDRQNMEWINSLEWGKRGAQGTSLELGAMRMQGEGKSSSTGSAENTQNNQAYGLKPKWELWQTMGSHLWSTGLSSSHRWIETESTDSLSYKLSSHQGAIYLQDQWKIRPLSTWTYGLRSEGEIWNWEQDFPSWKDLGLYPSTSFRQGIGENSDLHLSLSRRLKKPHPMMVLPLRRIMGPGILESGNPELRSEKQWNGEAGWALDWNANHVEINAFGSAASDLIERQSTWQGDTLIWQSANSGRQWRQGLELIFKLSPWKGFNVQGSASLARTENEGLSAYLHKEGKIDLSQRIAMVQIGIQVQSESAEINRESRTDAYALADLYLRAGIPRTGANLQIRTMNLWGQDRGDLHSSKDSYQDTLHIHTSPTINAQLNWSFGEKDKKPKEKQNRDPNEDSGSEMW